MTDIVVARIFFAVSETWLYKQDVAKYWFEIFSEYSIKIFRLKAKLNFDKFPGDMGGMFGVIGGFSMISFTEIIYFILKQIVLIIWHHNRTDKVETIHIYP
jgi:amiloride-sensitive sodium channel